MSERKIVLFHHVLPDTSDSRVEGEQRCSAENAAVRVSAWAKLHLWEHLLLVAFQRQFQNFYMTLLQKARFFLLDFAA